MGCTVIGRSNYTQIKLKERQFFLSVCLVSRSLVSKYCHKTDPHGENDLPKADKCV